MRTKDTPVLVISVGGEGVRENVMRTGADLYLDKPVLLKQLLTTLQLLLQHHHAGFRAAKRMKLRRAMQ